LIHYPGDSASIQSSGEGGVPGPTGFRQHQNAIRPQTGLIVRGRGTKLVRPRILWAGPLYINTACHFFSYMFTQFYFTCLIVLGFHCADYTDSLTLFPTDHAFFPACFFVSFVRVRDRSPRGTRAERARKPPCGPLILFPFALPDRFGIFSIFQYFPYGCHLGRMVRNQT